MLSIVQFRSIPLYEKVHPLQGGYIRRKIRTLRRPGLPHEAALFFYPRRLAETIATWGELLAHCGASTAFAGGQSARPRSVVTPIEQSLHCRRTWRRCLIHPKSSFCMSPELMHGIEIWYTARVIRVVRVMAATCPVSRYFQKSLLVLRESARRDSSSETGASNHALRTPRDRRLRHQTHATEQTVRHSPCGRPAGPQWHLLGPAVRCALARGRKLPP